MAMAWTLKNWDACNKRWPTVDQTARDSGMTAPWAWFTFGWRLTRSRPSRLSRMALSLFSMDGSTTFLYSIGSSRAPTDHPRLLLSEERREPGAFQRWWLPLMSSGERDGCTCFWVTLPLPFGMLKARGSFWREIPSASNPCSILKMKGA